MASRYYNRTVRVNTSEKYAKILRQRNIPFINQYTSPNQKYPTSEDFESITLVPHIWSMGDRFYKLADEWYNDPEMWWVIAWWNRMPTESHVKIGWSIDIPLPLEEVLPIWNK
jgi:hypothetical protein